MYIDLETVIELIIGTSNNVCYHIYKDHCSLNLNFLLHVTLDDKHFVALDTLLWRQNIWNFCNSAEFCQLMSLIKYYKLFCKNVPKHCNFKSLYLKFYRSNFKNFNCFGIAKEWRIFKVIIYSILTILKNLPEVPSCRVKERNTSMVYD